MTNYHSILNIGYRLGNLARDVEIVLESQKTKDPNKKKFHLEVFRVQEILKYIVDELEHIDEYGPTRIDIQDYIIQLTGEPIAEDDDEERKTLLRKIKQGITDRKYRADRALNAREVYELDLKLKGWKDKLLGELVKLQGSS